MQMRLFLWMSAALVTALRAQQNHLERVTQYLLPGGLPDGALLTFYIWHTGEYYGLTNPSGEPIKINFYNLPAIDIDGVYDIPAHLRFERTIHEPVTSNSFVDGAWRRETRVPEPCDIWPPGEGWWRVDVYKHDEYSLNVFFNGFWSGVRTFTQSLNSIKSAYVMPDHVNHQHVEIRIKLPNANIPPMSIAKFRDYIYGDMRHDKKLIYFPNFPVHSVIQFTAVLRCTAGSRLKEPSLVFSPIDGPPFFVKIVQIWDGDKRPNDPKGRVETYMTSNEKFQNTGGNMWVWEETREQKMDRLAYTTRLTREAPNGDLQHFYLERSLHNVLKLRVFYKQSNGVPGVFIYFNVPASLASYMDKPFNIMSHDGALLLHIDSSVKGLG